MMDTVALMNLLSRVQQGIQRQDDDQSSNQNPNQIVPFSAPIPSQPSNSDDWSRSPYNPNNIYANLPQIPQTPEEQRLKALQNAGPQKHTGGTGARIFDVLKSLGTTVLKGAGQGNLLGGLLAAPINAIATGINPQMWHNAQYQDQVGQARQQALDAQGAQALKIKQALEIGKYGQEGQKLDETAATNAAKARQTGFDNAHKVAELYGQLRLPIPPNIAAVLNASGLTGAKPPAKEKKPLTRYDPTIGDSVWYDAENGENLRDKSGNVVIAREARETKPDRIHSGSDVYEYDPKSQTYKLVIQGREPQPTVSESTETVNPAEQQHYHTELGNWQKARGAFYDSLVSNDVPAKDLNSHMAKWDKSFPPPEKPKATRVTTTTRGTGQGNRIPAQTQGTPIPASALAGMLTHADVKAMGITDVNALRKALIDSHHTIDESK